MEFAGLNKTSTVDFPGVLSAVVFTPGCNFSCYYCHNRQHLEQAPRLSEQEVIAFFKKRAGMLDGVVITGGEPTLQHGLIAFAAHMKQLGYKVKLDTNGSNPDTVREMIASKLVDYIALDYKAPLERYITLCGLSGGSVLETAQLLFSSDVQWEMRTTLIPQISKEDLISMAETMPVLPAYALQLYRPQPGDTQHLKTLLPYTPRQLRELSGLIKSYQPHTFVRG